MINVLVKLFAVVRERAGRSEVRIQIPAGSTVVAARDAIARQMPQVEALLRTSAFAVNQAYASLDSTLSDGDELAVIPPVSGG